MSLNKIAARRWRASGLRIWRTKKEELRERSLSKIVKLFIVSEVLFLLIIGALRLW
jgi:hypothetical protein